MSKRASHLDKGPKLKKMDMRSGTWKIKNLYKENYLRRIGWCCMDWIDLPEDKDQRRAIVNTEVKFWFRKCWEIIE
jgi:hypothetical protein